MKSSLLNPGCKIGTNGFRLALHMPVDFPHISNYFYNIPFNQQTTLIVKPQMIYASKDINEYTPENRQCYMRNEKTLKFFKVYTHSNCELECNAKFIHETCGCVSFSMPHDNKTKICGHSQLQCVHDAQANYSSQFLQKKLIEKQLKRDLKHGKADKNDVRFKILKEMKKNFCGCLPTCTFIKYDAEIDRVNYDFADDE